MRRSSNFIFAVIAMVCMIAPSVSFRAQVRPVYDMGAIGLGQALKRLQTTASVMHTGAHPDDEDSGLLAYLARKEQARTAYLSLNRGDGGQNVIGEELFESLGVIRTEELLQARRLDGGSQYFTRVMDYGFSKKRDEAARIWGEREVLADMVRAIRLFRPLVVISRFSGTPADGHGQHQLAGYLTPIAFKAAADASEFPEQIKEGLRPWRALKLYMSQGFAANPQNVPTLGLNTGEYDPLIGRSYFEIAMEGRSQHKSQEMGLLELRGRQSSGVRLLENLAGKTEKESSVFDGIDTSIKGIAALTNSTDEGFVKKLAELQETADMALNVYDPYSPQKLIPVLAKGFNQAREAAAATSSVEAKTILRQKEEEFASLLAHASGTVIDALSNSETIVAGDTADIAVRVFAPESTAVVVKSTELKIPHGWKSETMVEPAASPAQGFRPRREDSRFAAYFKVTVGENADLTQPYWLEKPRHNSTFDWTSANVGKNLPFQDPLVTVVMTLEIGGQEVKVERNVQYRFADDIRGEIRRDINIVPAITIGLESNLLIAPVATKPVKHRVVMSVTNNRMQAVSGSATFDVPAGWELTPRSAAFELKQKGDKTALSFDVTVPANSKPSSYKLQARASAGTSVSTKQVQEIAYPHIQTHRIYSDAEVTAQVLDLKVAPVRVGYIAGSGDKVAAAIKRLGLNVTMLGEKELATGDLSQFDTIVVGIRASQVRPDFVANNGRLLDFVKAGGTMIVQYQQQEFTRMNLTPYPAKIETNVRVVDENAPVKILQPKHPVFNFPNKIGDSDWLNWVQERDLYTFTEFDPKYTPLLESHDEGEKESVGGMVYAEVGKGKYIYTAYSWFRQLPAGNPGAYRIFANMLSLPKAK